MEVEKTLRDYASDYVSGLEERIEELENARRSLHVDYTKVEKDGKRIAELEKELICTQEINAGHNIHIDKLEDSLAQYGDEGNWGRKWVDPVNNKVWAIEGVPRIWKGSKEKPWTLAQEALKEDDGLSKNNSG